MLYFDRFDICDAYYLFASDWHSGMSSPEYRIFTRLHKLGYKPGANLSLNTSNENVKSIYGGLVRRTFPGQCGWMRRAKDRI